MARPKSAPDITLDDQVLKLAAINCTWAEIAAVTGMNEHTLRKRFGQTYKKGRETGKMSLKRKMYSLAIDSSNVTMCIWLSKQMLGYTDKQDNQYQHLISQFEKVKSLNNQDLAASITQDLKKLNNDKP